MNDNEIPQHVADYIQDEGLILTLRPGVKHKWYATIQNDDRTSVAGGHGTTIAEAADDVHTNEKIGRYIAGEIRKAREE